MKRILYSTLALFAAVSFVSCGGGSDNPDTKIDKAVVHVDLRFDFSRIGQGITVDYATTFDCLDVKALCKYNGVTEGEETVTAANKTWKKDITVTSAGTIELGAAFSLKKEFEANLPEYLTAAVSTPVEKLVDFDRPYVDVDYYSGSTKVKSEKLFLEDISLAKNCRAKEIGLEKVKAYLERRNKQLYSAKIAF